MKGMELCERYFRKIVLPAVSAVCPEAIENLAAGLAGDGSECFGFDDEISRDHDFGPRVCIWLTDRNAEIFGGQLNAILSALPETFEGISFVMKTKEASGRSGVLRISDFYQKYTGLSEAPTSWKQWITIPEEQLAVCTNGKVFMDGEGEFTRIRNGFLSYYPEDVRIKKIAARAALMAQAGQYNYARCAKRGEKVAAFMALNEFVKNGISMVYLLNRRYMPYYKWAHRGLYDLEILPETGRLFMDIVEQGFENTVDRIETVCSLVLSELARQGLCEPGDNYLLAHTDEITSKIGEPVIRALPLMFG